MSEELYPEGVEAPSEDYDPQEPEPSQAPDEQGSEDFPKMSSIAKTTKCSVTFQRSLPMGTRGTFTHEGHTWIAYPASKNQAIFLLNDRLIGTFARINDELIRWINARPQDADLVMRALDLVSEGRRLQAEFIDERIRNATK